MNRIVMLLLLVSPTFVTAQGWYGKIDTLIVAKRGDEVNAVKVYNGELLVMTGNYGDGSLELFHSNDRGESFAPVLNPAYQPIRAVPGKGVYSSCIIDLTDTTSADRVWIVNGSEIVYDDTLAVPGSSIPYSIAALYINPIDPTVWIIKTVQGTAGGPYEHLLLSVDSGKRWDVLPIPVSTYNGSARRIQVRFDYTDRKAWFVGVNGRDVFGGEDKYEWHRTADNGQTFTRVTDDLGYANGMYGPQTSITFPYRRQLPWQRELSRGNMVIFHHATNKKDTIEWTKNIYASLYPNNDNATVDIYADAPISRSDESSGFTYHPERPGTFVVSIYMDSLIGSTRTRTVGLVATTDTGRTWKWIVKPEQQLNLQSMSIDPMDGAVYCCLNGYNDPADLLNGFVLIRVTPEKETSVASVGNEAVARVYPNPASSVVTIRADDASEADYIRIIDVAGRVCLEASAVECTRNNCVLDVATLATGLYNVSITHKDHSTTTVRLAVIH